MSSTEENVELKAGHPPAVKAGGMRVARPHHSSTGETTPASKDVAAAAADDEEFPATPTKPEKQTVIISGVVTKGDKDFTAEAIKTYHEKPQVAKEKGHKPVMHNIQQPK